jgi:hypothetical protein
MYMMYDQVIILKYINLTHSCKLDVKNEKK